MEFEQLSKDLGFKEPRDLKVYRQHCTGLTGDTALYACCEYGEHVVRAGVIQRETSRYAHIGAQVLHAKLHYDLGEKNEACLILEHLAEELPEHAPCTFYKRLKALSKQITNQAATQ